MQVKLTNKQRQRKGGDDQNEEEYDDEFDEEVSLKTEFFLRECKITK